MLTIPARRALVAFGVSLLVLSATAAAAAPTVNAAPKHLGGRTWAAAPKHLGGSIPPSVIADGRYWG